VADGNKGHIEWVDLERWYTGFMRAKIQAQARLVASV